ncbi:SPOR domain-containing protein [Nautilia lithotrophica]
MPNKDDLLNLNNKKNLKKPLIYGAIAFLVFIIAILGFAIYNNTASKQDNVVLPPQIQEEKQDTMFKEVPIEESAVVKEKKENLADKLIKKEADEKVNTAETEQNNTTKQTKNEVEEKKANIKPETKKTETKPAVKKQTAVSKGKYYVQVAALMKYKKPNQKFLNLIKKEGYNYRLYETYYVKNGKKIEVIKILIGPFSTKTMAKKELKRIKETITQNAFIYKVK